jgi:hypothetical protein
MSTQRKKRNRIVLPSTQAVSTSTTVHKGNGKNKGGRPVGSLSKQGVAVQLMKGGLVQLFNTSRAPALLQAFLNMQLPSVLKPANVQLLTPEEDRHYRRVLLANFKWAVEQIIKVVPKEHLMSGSVQHEHTLAGLTKRATVHQKSESVVEMVRKHNEEQVVEYSNE